MEGPTINGVESEEISDSFICCVCLELLYKPVVLSCGHISCFWCVFRSMSYRRESHCPICRNPYLHFPSVCQMLHFLLQKMYTVVYRKREEYVSKEERETGFFSPQFDTHMGQEDYCFGSLLNTSIAERNVEHCCYEEELDTKSPIEAGGTTGLREPSMGESETSGVGESNSSQHELDGKCGKVSTADLLCAACKELLFRPVVLNCGHAYCEACVVNPANEEEMFKCQVCQSLDPRGFPKVCLVLDQFLEENFPKEYALRDVMSQKQDPKSTRSRLPKSKKRGSFDPSGDSPWWADRRTNVHYRVGCDSCGVFPIIGDRYRCRDCVEKIGYDLCGDCYKTRSGVPGRFNQQHTSEHRFELMEIPYGAFRLVAGQLDNDVATTTISVPASPVANPGNEQGPMLFRLRRMARDYANNFSTSLDGGSQDSSEDEQRDQQSG